MKIIEPAESSELFSNEQTAQIRSALESDRSIVYPTDTLYGLGANAFSQSAVDSLYTLKSRVTTPMSVLLASVDDLFKMTTALSDKSRDLIHAFMPGAITVICKTNIEFAPQLRSTLGTVGFRVPGDPISRQIPKIFGKPITTTSVNPTGLKPASCAPEVEAYYGDRVALMIDIGSLPTSRGSTVIDLSNEPFKILREGEISRQALQEFLN